MTTAALVSAFHPDFRNLYKGIQARRVPSDFRQQVSLALEKQLSGQLVNSYASSLINIPVTAARGAPTLATLPAKIPLKQHPPLTASNSVANCNAASHLKAFASSEHRKLDRSISEPVDKSQQTLRLSPQNSSRYKTELCRPFEENGTCKYGDKCQFAHGIAELRTLTRHPKYKTELCRTFHSTGFCPYGPRCHFIHNSEDSKKCLLSNLQSGSSLSPTSLSSPSMSPKDYDICGFSIGSAGELSPTSSTSSIGGSPTSSLNGFFLEDHHSFPQVPQTAPPTITNGGFFSGDFIPLKPLSALQPLLLSEEYIPSREDSPETSTMEVLAPELDSRGKPAVEADSNPPAEVNAESSEGDRNQIRLPIFSKLSLGSIL